MPNFVRLGLHKAIPLLRRVGNASDEFDSKLRNITLCGNQSARDIEEFCSV
jgi:hypothetical protein